MTRVRLMGKSGAFFCSAPSARVHTYYRTWLFSVIAKDTMFDNNNADGTAAETSVVRTECGFE